VLLARFVDAGRNRTQHCDPSSLECSGQTAGLCRRGGRRERQYWIREDYLPQAQANIKANGGRFLVAGQKITSLEGTPPKRVIVTAWDSIEKIDEWFNSPEFKDLRKVGDKYAKFRLFTVEGVPQ